MSLQPHLIIVTIINPSEIVDINQLNAIKRGPHNCRLLSQPRQWRGSPLLVAPHIGQMLVGYNSKYIFNSIDSFKEKIIGKSLFHMKIDGFL